MVRKANPIAMDDSSLLLEYASVCERIGVGKSAGFVPQQMVKFRNQYFNEILRRLNARSIFINKENVL